MTDSLIDQILAEVPGLDAAKVKVDAKSSAGRRSRSQPSRPRRRQLQVQGTPWFYLAVGLNQPFRFQPRSFTPSEFRPATSTRLSRRIERVEARRAGGYDGESFSDVLDDALGR